jgi:hypothetical protein
VFFADWVSQLQRQKKWFWLIYRYWTLRFQISNGRHKILHLLITNPHSYLSYYTCDLE